MDSMIRSGQIIFTLVSGGPVRNFAPGEVYFRVTYPDRSLKYPGIESFVYLGKNLSDEDTEDTWYFQPASDFGRFGSAIAAGAKERPVICASASDAADMLDLGGLIAVLKNAKRRRDATDDEA